MKNYLNLMRLSGAILVALHISVAMNCQTLLNENFEYPAGSSLTTNGWTAHSGEGTNPVKVFSTGLTFPEYGSSNIGLSAILNNTGEDVNKTFTTITSGTVFCAFLIKVNAIDSGYFLHLGNTPIGTTNHYGKVFIKGTGNSFYLGLSKKTGSPVFATGSTFATGATYLVVLKYIIIEGTSNDEVSLFIMTSSIPGTEPSVPLIGPLKDATQSDLANVSAVALRQYSAKQDILIDGIRIVTKWEDAVGTVTKDKKIPNTGNPSIYPIPVSSELIVSNIKNVTQIEIFNLTGRKVISLKTGTDDIMKIPVSHLSRGLYLIRFINSDGTKTMKFVKS